MDDNVLLFLQKGWEGNALERKNAFEGVLLISFYTVFSFFSIFSNTKQNRTQRWRTEERKEHRAGLGGGEGTALAKEEVASILVKVHSKWAHGDLHESSLTFLESDILSLEAYLPS